MFCTRCGGQIEDDSRFCIHCGATIEQNNSNLETNIGDDIPMFSAPETADDIPTFSAPGEKDGIPTFAPPENDSIPVFKAPTNSRVNGTACHYHSDEPAVGRCARCGKPLCQDCCDSYGVSSGQYAGQHLCYDCTQELVAENVSTLQANYATIKTQYIVCLVGVAIGALVGLMWAASSGPEAALVYGILCAAIGGSAGNFFRRYLSSVPGFFVSTGNIVLSLCIGLAKAVGCFFIYAIMALIETIRKIVYYVSYMKRTSGFIESDSAALQQMKDYMEFTMVRNKHREMSLESLMQEGSQLYNNSFAQMVRDQGEEKAEAYMSQCVTRIAENGEIIREFAA